MTDHSDSLDDSSERAESASHTDPAGKPAPASRFNWIMRCGLLVAVALVLFLKGSQENGDAATIQGIDDPHIEKVVGLVVCGHRALLGDRRRIEVPTSTGSAFVISRAGHLLTNRQVIQEVDNLSRSPMDLESERNILGAVELEPVVWVFLEGKKLDAEITFVFPNQDLAILKVNQTFEHVFRLAPKRERELRGRMWAMEFPEIAHTQPSKLIGPVRSPLAASSANVASFFKARDFQFTLTPGVAMANLWIDTSPKSARNSGGPLIGEDGSVLGIRVFLDGSRLLVEDGSFLDIRVLLGGSTLAPHAYSSFALADMSATLDEHVEGITWD